MSLETVSVDPVFDPEQIGLSLKLLREQLPIRAVMLDGVLGGDTMSKRKGEGFDIDGIRDYEAGDDPRSINWSATAGQPDGWPQYQEHYKDITPTAWLLTDALQSRYSVNPGYFSEQGLALSAVLSVMQMAGRQGMSVAYAAQGDHARVAHSTPVHVNRAYVRQTADRFAAEINDPKPSPETRKGLNDLTDYAGKLCHNSLVVLVSDFRDANKPAWSKSLKRLSAHNDVIAVEVTNPWDYALPETVSRFVTEQGSVYIPTGRKGREQREAYQDAAATQSAEIEDVLKSAHAYHIRLSTDEPRWTRSLRGQLKA